MRRRMGPGPGGGTGISGVLLPPLPLQRTRASNLINAMLCIVCFATELDCRLPEDIVAAEGLPWLHLSCQEHQRPGSGPGVCAVPHVLPLLHRDGPTPRAVPRGEGLPPWSPLPLQHMCLVRPIGTVGCPSPPCRLHPSTEPPAVRTTEAQEDALCPHQHLCPPAPRALLLNHACCVEFFVPAFGNTSSSICRAVLCCEGERRALAVSYPAGAGTLRQVSAVAVYTPALEHTPAGVLLADAVANQLAMEDGRGPRLGSSACRSVAAANAPGICHFASHPCHMALP